MGKYKQWLHHQEVGARLRDEIATHEAEREQVLKLAPDKATALPDRSNPIIAALLGQGLALKATEPPAAQGGRNGASTTVTAAASEAVTEVRTGKESTGTAEAKVAAASKTTEANAQAAAQSAPEEAASAKPTATNRAKTGAAPAKNNAEKPATSATAAAAASAQPDTIDPLLEQLLAQAENAPADPLEALNFLASQGPNLTRGETPQPITPAPSAPLAPSGGSAPTLPTAPLTSSGGPASTLPTAPLAPSGGSAGPSALKALLGENKASSEPQKQATGSGSAAVAVGVETITISETSVHAEGAARGEKLRSDTDELVASRPTEGYTEPRLIVPQWLRSMELGQEGQGSTASGEATAAGESKQRLSVSLPFENEEDMRLHESVERWWQRWRQQG